MNRNRMNLKLFEADTNIIDRSGAESLIPIQESNEIIQGTIAQSAVLSRGRKDNDGEIQGSGNLLGKTDWVKGTFNTATKAFTEGE